MNIKHSCESSEWYTPEWLVEKCRKVLGTIHFDPASCEEANKVVKAIRYCTKFDPPFFERWQGNVFCNPPGGRGHVREFWDTMSKSFEKGQIKTGIFICYSIEALQQLQDCEYPITNYTFCIPKKRIAFVPSVGEKNRPSHANAIVLLTNEFDAFLDFYNEFDDIGFVSAAARFE